MLSYTHRGTEVPEKKGIEKMKIAREQSLKAFPFWGGAEQTRMRLDDDDLEIIENELVALLNEQAVDATEINDLFWFETDYIAQLLGYDDWESLSDDRV